MDRFVNPNSNSFSQKPSYTIYLLFWEIFELINFGEVQRIGFSWTFSFATKGKNIYFVYRNFQKLRWFLRCRKIPYKNFLHQLSKMRLVPSKKHLKCKHWNVFLHSKTMLQKLDRGLKVIFSTTISMPYVKNLNAWENQNNSTVNMLTLRIIKERKLLDTFLILWLK